WDGTTPTGWCSETPRERGTSASASGASSRATPRWQVASTSRQSSTRAHSSSTSTPSSSVSVRSSRSARREPMSETATHLASGKVREIYALDGERLLLVASDRISTFDVILPTPIPDKGRVLTGMSAFWFSRTRSLVPNHLLDLGDDGRSTTCLCLRMLPVELV